MAFRIGCRLPKPCATRTKRITEAAVKPSGLIRLTFASSPAATKPTDFQSALTSFSSSGCQPPRIAWRKRSTARTAKPAAVIYGKTVGPTFEYMGETGIVIVCQSTAPAETKSPRPISASGTARDACGFECGSLTLTCNLLRCALKRESLVHSGTIDAGSPSGELQSAGLAGNL